MGEKVDLPSIVETPIVEKRQDDDSTLELITMNGCTIEVEDSREGGQ